MIASAKLLQSGGLHTACQGMRALSLAQIFFIVLTLSVPLKCTFVVGDDLLHVLWHSATAVSLNWGNADESGDMRVIHMRFGRMWAVSLDITQGLISVYGRLAETSKRLAVLHRKVVC